MAVPQHPATRRSLSWRVLWLTIAAVLGTEVLIFVPSLARERHAWLENRITGAQLAALSAAAAPDGVVNRTTRDDLLRLAGAVAIRLDEPGHTMMVLAAPQLTPAADMVDLRGETLVTGIRRALAALLVPPGHRLLHVAAESPLRPGATVDVLLHEGALNRHLRDYAGTIFALSLLVAVVTGVLVYLALYALLVRPMRRITESIAAFRADPERSAPLDPQSVTPWRDEIGVASHELAAMQRELRTALWRNARLAAIGAAVAKVGHDMRGILSPALLTAERLQMSKEPSVKKAGDVLVRAVERATALLRGTLDFAREGPLAPARAAVQLRAVMTAVAEQVAASDRHLALTVDIPEEAGVHADPEHLVRALANLVRNAAEAGARHVRVAAQNEGREMVVLVSDDGPGLPDAVRERLFEPFVTGGRPGGTGLGLAIAHDLARANGGTLTLVSSGPGGTVFRLGLPASMPPRPAAPAAQN
jgi:signal transduction histidine kinase